MLAPSEIEREHVRAQPRIEVSGLTVVYPNGTTALDNVSFTLGPGTICGLAGTERQRQVHALQVPHGVCPPHAG